MHLKSPLLFGLMAIILLAGTVTPVLSQSSPDSISIVINEVEINPANGSEFVELYNPTSQSIDISGWTITPSASWKQYEIVQNTEIEPDSFMAFTHHSSWFKDFGDTVSLSNSSGELIDQTPLLADQDNDANTWQRNTDGLDTDSESDWRLKTMSPQSSNGKIITTSEAVFSFTAETDKTEYTFGETLTIFGSASETLYRDAYNSSPDIVKIKIHGPNYYDTLSINPDRDLNFSTSLNIQQVVGFNAGNYNVDISYGNYSVETEFVIVEELESSSAEDESHNVEIITDKASYIPGETVVISASTDSSLEYAGLDYSVLDPNGLEISSGTIFSNSQFSTVHQAGGGEIYPFSTQILIPDVNPVYGTYQISGIYKAQDPIYRSAGLEVTASTTFELVEDVKEDVLISLSTDKEVYEIGDIVKISGRSNQIWTEDLELHILQTGFFNPGSGYQAFSPLDEKYSIKLNGDGTFEYNFKIPPQTQRELSYGDYLIKVSEYFGENSKTIKVVENPESFVDIRTPLGLKIDKSEVVLGTAITISGKIMNYEQNENTYNYGNQVRITFTDSNGVKLMSEDRIQSSNDYGKSPNAPLTFTAMPDEVGNYQVSTILHPLQFDIGEYGITANHYATKTTESIQFEIVTAQSEILSTPETQEPLTIEICSSTAHHETIKKDLKNIGKGEIPPSMESIDCDDVTDFATGEKLVIRGTVELKQMRYLDQSSTNPSGSTQTGHGYTTNYAQNEINYVELSIPYPHTLIVSTSYKTTPVEGENYTGGGGSGAASTQDEVSGSYVGTGAKDDPRYRDVRERSERHTGYDAQIVLRDITKNLTDMRIKAYPDEQGNFSGIFDLRAGVFVDGVYKLKATYFGHHADTVFSINDNSLKGGLQPELVLDFPRDEFYPGEIVPITGQIKNVYYYDSVVLQVETPDVSQINCLVGQSCDLGNSAKKIRVSEGVEGAQFFMNFKLPLDAPLGKYTVIAETHFGEMRKSFFVINESDVISPVSTEPSSKLSKVIEKFNRIPDNKIPISLDEKSIEESTLAPRVIQGSLFTSARGDESNVSLQITTNDGQCVIGQNSNCLVSESTRKPGAIYSIVTIDDTNYKIRYSGNDVRLEKFSIVPETSNSKIDIDNWNVEIIKDEQPTRFYYKVSYVALE